MAGLVKDAVVTVVCFWLQLEDSNKRFCSDIEEIRRDKDQLNTQIRSLQLGR